MSSLDRMAPQVLSVLRIITALLFMEHGLMKAFHFPGVQPGVPDPLPMVLVVAAWIEIILGGLIAIGLFTRAAAFVCAGQMAAAYFIAHFPGSPWPGINQGDAAIMFCFIFLYLVFAGTGPWSVDAMRKPATASR